MQATSRELGRITQTGCANASAKLHLTFDWGAAGSNNGNLKGQTIAAPGFSQTQYYEYDATNRLKIAVEGAPVPGSLTCPATSSWCREYNYDHFGNRWVSSNRTMHIAVPTSQSAGLLAGHPVRAVANPGKPARRRSANVKFGLSRDPAAGLRRLRNANGERSRQRRIGGSKVRSDGAGIC